MLFWFILLIAVISTVLCLYLWFREVRRIMSERREMVENAARQLVVYQERVLKMRGDAEIAAISERSERIYQQSVALYNQTMHKPLVFLPAVLMRFKAIPVEKRV